MFCWHLKHCLLGSEGNARRPVRDNSVVRVMRIWAICRNCEAACPCVFLSPPTEGECKVLIGWHIDKVVMATPFSML